MPLSRLTIDRLAALTAPVIHFLVPQAVAQAPGGLPAVAGGDIAAVTAWWMSLSDAQAQAVLAQLTGDVATQARQELAPPTPPASTAKFPSEPGLETLRGDPHVDREDVWVGLQTLLDSEKRILHVRGDSKVGKSRTVDLVRMFVSSDPVPTRKHVVIDINLDGLTFEEAMREVFVSFDEEKVPDRTSANSNDDAWLRTVAKTAHKRSMSLQKPAIPWFVFDHVERLQQFNDHVAFFNRLVELVVDSRREPNSARVVLIDRREVAVNKEFRAPVILAPLTQEQIARYLVRKNPGLDPAVAATEALERMRRAQESSKDKPAQYMDFLKEELS